ncbi:MAG: hypothetical protein IKR38_09210 [Bacteroidales bacterium]|nr:hypothetical protein [Bacteroidales bacterium]
MKKYLAIAILALAAACTNEAIDQNNEVIEEQIVPESTAAPVLYAVFEPNEIDSKAGFTYDGDGHYDHYWNAGDHIYVFPKEDIYDIYECTDASKGAFTLLKDRTGSATAVDKIYAIYNSELADDGNVIDDGYANMWPAASPFIATPISWNYTVSGPDKNGAYGYNNIMAAAIDDSGEKLVFKSTVGWLRLQLKGTQKVKSIMITSNVGNIFPISMSEVYVTNMAGTPGFDYEDGLNGNQRKLSISAPYAQLNTVTATDFYITLPPCTMSKGFQLDIEYADGTSQTITTSTQEYQIKRNIVTKLPERTVGTTIANLSSSGTANTYIVQSAGNKKFDATVKGSSGESVGTPVRAAVLWESFNTSTTPSVGDLVTNVTYSDGYVYFRVPFTNKGNAVIAVYDSSDNILWSWLIWINNLDGLTTPDDLGSYVSGFKLMKYPLGLITSGERGLYYQWGRKDPFYFSVTNGTDELQVKGTSAQTVTQVGTTVSGAISHPTTFYVPTPSYHWGPVDNAGLWRDDAKTVYDPCPAGWKVVSSDKITAAIANSFSNGGSGSGVFNPLSALAVSAGGAFIYTAGENRYWTSGASTNGSRVLTKAINVDGSVLSIAENTGTSVGYQLRCEKM